MRILVAMSGGVDSSVVAHLLKEEGHELIGVMMKLWTDPLAPAVQRAIPTKCCSVEHIQRARAVCRQLDIPFYVLSLEDEFRDNVVEPFLASYRSGETPNPCIECNRTIKFGRLLMKAQELGCEKLATGHYARVATEESAGGKQRHVLLEAEDSRKDQSYYLYSLSQKQLGRVLFPLGSMDKQEVFALAERYGVPVPSHYRESQDLCFFPEKNPEAFLRRYLPDTEPGEIRTEDGRTVGRHKGLPFYTIGQRRGLGIGGLQIPLHVSKKDPHTNTVYVAENGADRKKKLYVDTIHWISWSPKIREKIPFSARVHSLGTKEPGTLTFNGKTGVFHFERPVRGIAPGQSVVLYRGNEVAGGGRIIYPPS